MQHTLRSQRVYRKQQVRRKKSTWNVSPGSIIVYLALTVVFLLIAYPFFYILSLSIMPYANYISEPIHAWPDGFTPFYFQQIFRNAHLIGAFEISVARTLVGAVISVVATAMAGYALSRPGLKYRRILSIFFLVPMFVSGGIIPFFLVIQGLGLTNTFWALVLPGMVTPFNLFLVKAYFTEYSPEIIEAATVDGASQWLIFWPTSTPIIATMTLLYGVTYWNEYVGAGILVQSDLYPATVVLKDMTNTRLFDFVGASVPFVSQSFIAAVSMVLIVPMLFAYPLLQRYLVKGLMAGAIKG
jgi:putative aldouronate transport system permease protein